MTATEKEGPPPGFDALLIKPFAPRDVLQCCEALWNEEATLPAEAPGEEASEPSLATGTFDRMKASMPPAQLRALYDFALTDAESRVERMSAAAQEGDEEAYRREAHALKGSCGMVGASRLRTLASAAEDEGLPAATVIHFSSFQHFDSEIARIRHMLESLLPSAS